jgi:hypothetical protein
MKSFPFSLIYILYFNLLKKSIICEMGGQPTILKS